mmetsp:Transcript_65814/g.140804  ORF Transcript_65814/g.140804 Transcript_65814/m.140804 type:complete len:549 (-) Transcript_65814:16-1662(-)
MDFDDLDETETSFGPLPAELRQELLQNAKPSPIPHPKPEGRNFGARGYMKMLYLTSMGSNKRMGMLQASNMLVNAPRKESDTVIYWTVFEGSIPSDSSGHQNPEIAEMYKAYGPDFYSYLGVQGYAQMQETWLNLDEELERLGEHLAKEGPYDGIMGFDQGGMLAVAAAREAQEGRENFKNKFRFLILCSTHGHKELSLNGQGARRPKAPLKIPVVITYSDQCLVQPINAYQDLALYFDPAHRQILKHNLGHAPPKFDADTEGITVLTKFIDKMRFGTPFEVHTNEETNALAGLSLPLVRAPPPILASSPLPIRIIVVPDPLGKHGPTATDMLADTTRPFDEDKAVAVERVKVLYELRGWTLDTIQAASEELASEFTLEEVAYSAEHRTLQWHPKEYREHSWQDLEDEIALSAKAVSLVASDLLAPLPAILQGDRVAIVGIGTGSYIARAVAEAIIRERGVIPLGLFLVAPPTITPRMEAKPDDPTPDFASLVNSSVRIFTVPAAINSNPWRWEIATLGPFSQSVHSSDSDLLASLISELRRIGDTTS